MQSVMNERLNLQDFCTRNPRAHLRLRRDRGRGWCRSLRSRMPTVPGDHI